MVANHASFADALRAAQLASPAAARIRMSERSLRLAIARAARYTGIHHGLCSRQLRLVHLQPRPVPGRTGRGGRGAPQRRGDAGRGRGHEAGADSALAGPVHAARGRDSGAAHPPHGGESADSGRLPGPPGHRRSLWRQGGPRADADARQNQRGRARRQRHLCRTAHAAHLHALPLADRGSRSRCRPNLPSRRDTPEGGRHRARSSWACGIAACPSRACSSIPRACSPRAATR